MSQARERPRAGNILNPDNRTFNANCAIATYLVHVAAASLGLGSQWVSITGGYESPLKSILKVPDVYRLSVLVPLAIPPTSPPLHIGGRRVIYFTTSSTICLDTVRRSR